MTTATPQLSQLLCTVLLSLHDRYRDTELCPPVGLHRAGIRPNLPMLLVALQETRLSVDFLHHWEDSPGRMVQVDLQEPGSLETVYAFLDPLLRQHAAVLLRAKDC